MCSEMCDVSLESVHSVVFASNHALCDRWLIGGGEVISLDFDALRVQRQTNSITSISRLGRGRSAPCWLCDLETKRQMCPCSRMNTISESARASPEGSTYSSSNQPHDKLLDTYVVSREEQLLVFSNAVSVEPALDSKRLRSSRWQLQLDCGLTSWEVCIPSARVTATRLARLA